MSSKRSSTASTSSSSASGASRRRARVASDSEQDESPMDSGLTESHASGARHATRGGREQTDGGSRAAASSAAFSGGSAHLAGKVKHASKHDDGDDDQAPFNAGQRAVQQARSQESQQANAARHRDKRARQDDSSDGEHPANLNNHGSTAAAAAAAATTSSSTGGIKTSSSQSEKSSGYGGSRSAGRAAEHASANGQAEGDDDDDDDEANIMSILITTDNHIGYLENDPIRGNDSFMTFEEILLLAQEENVDFILLGGDLFHENKPSRNTLHNTIKLLRNYCMGDRPCSVQVLSDPKQNFPSNMGGTVNYLDPNFNIGMPIFTIHGNHDDPASDGLSAMDLLSGINLVNYFGRVKEIDNITVSPVLLQKGQTKLALFGLGAVRDERLHRTFNNKQVQMLRPEEDQDEWFNMFVLHQNRCKHGPTNYIPEVFLDDFLDLVLWGHEHECRIQPEQSTNGFEVIQPGSSIATSLAEGESVRKHVGILRIKKRSYALKTIPLRTVRPFYMQDIVLSEEGLLPSRPDDVVQVLADRVNELIAKCDEEHGNDEIVMKPLIRLRVEYSGGFQMTNIQRFGQQFVERVANPKDLLQFYRRRASHVPGQRGGIPEPDSHADEHDSAARQRSELDASRMQDLVNDILARSKQPLELLSEQDLGTAVHAFVEKDEKEAIRDFVKYALEMTQANLIKAPKDSIQGEEDIMASVRTNRKEHYKSAPRPTTEASDAEDSSDMDSSTSIASSSKRGGRAAGGAGRGAAARGRGTTAATRGTRGRGASTSRRSRASAFSEDDEDEDEKDEPEDELEDDDGDSDSAASTSSRSRRQTSSSTRSRKSATAMKHDDVDDDDDEDEEHSRRPISSATARSRGAVVTPVARRGGRGGASQTSLATTRAAAAGVVVLSDDEDDEDQKPVGASRPVISKQPRASHARGSGRGR